MLWPCGHGLVHIQPLADQICGMSLVVGSAQIRRKFLWILVNRACQVTGLHGIGWLGDLDSRLVVIQRYNGLHIL